MVATLPVSNTKRGEEEGAVNAVSHLYSICLSIASEVPTRDWRPVLMRWSSSWLAIMSVGGSRQGGGGVSKRPCRCGALTLFFRSAAGSVCDN